MKSSQQQKVDVRVLTGIDRVVHEPARLMILMYLYPLESADFVFLLRTTDLTMVNFSSHLTRLEEVGYVVIEKSFVGKRPRTKIQFTGSGRKAIEDYRETMREALFKLSQ